jgi:membrane protease YdiL (CAAX protease family)
MKENSIKFIFFIILTSVLLTLVFFISKILPFTDYTNNFLAQLLVVCIVVAYIKLKHEYDIFNFNLTTFIYGLWLGSFIFIVFVLNILTNIETIRTIDFTRTTIVLLIFSNITVGLFEEILCRGIIFNSFLKNNTPIHAALISSGLFGAVHLLNLTHSNDYIATMTQIIYATFLGILFAAIYYVTKNIWSVIFLHSALDISSGFYEIEHIDENLNNALTSITSSFITIIILLPAFSLE